MFSVSDLRCVTVVFLIVIATAVIVRIIMAIIIIMFTSCYAVLCPQGSLYNSIMEI
jgi:hypothetical protein